MRNSATNKIEPCTVVISAEASSADVTKFWSKAQSLSASVQGSYKDSDNESTGPRQTWDMEMGQASALFGGSNTFGGSNSAMDGLFGGGDFSSAFKSDGPKEPAGCCLKFWFPPCAVFYDKGCACPDMCLALYLGCWFTMFCKYFSSQL